MSDAARCDCFALSGSYGAHDLACPNAAAQDLLPCTCHSDDLEPYCPRHTPGELDVVDLGEWKSVVIEAVQA